jgi:pantoate--beta-alanine ligase
MSELAAFRSVDSLRAQVATWKAAGLRVGLVPTMGALHDGHLSLVDKIGQHVDRVIVSIFVNPTQFAAHEDLDTYPRQEADDLTMLRALNSDGDRVHGVYLPTADEIYPAGFATQISMQGPALGLETDDRPHFFGGVALVVAKLLSQSQTDAAIFGEKDYQQLLVIRRMAQDLDLPVEIIGAPIIREADGLAMSSRNAYLNQAQRAIAGHLNVILQALASSTLPVAQAEQQAREALLAAGFDKVDYASLRDGDSLAPIDATTTHRRALIAARLGDTRLIDNMSA